MTKFAARLALAALTIVALGCFAHTDASVIATAQHSTKAFQQARATAYAAFALDEDHGLLAFRANVRRFSKEADSWNDLADALSRMGRQHDYLYNEALTAYERALAIAPDNAVIRYDHAVTLLNAGKTSAGLREADAAAGLGRRDFDVQYLLGHALGDMAATGPSYGDPASAARYAARVHAQLQDHRTRDFTDRLIEREVLVYYSGLHDRFPRTIDKARRAAQAYAAAAAADRADIVTPYEACALRALAINETTAPCAAPYAKPTMPILPRGGSR